MHMKRLLCVVSAVSLLYATPALAAQWVQQGDEWYYQTDSGTYAKDTYVDGKYVDLSGKYVEDTALATTANKVFDKMLKENKNVGEVPLVNEDEVILLTRHIRYNRLMSTVRVRYGWTSERQYLFYLYNEDVSRIKKDIDEVNTKLNKVAGEIIKLKDDIEKVKAINNYICDNYDYDYTLKSTTLKDALATKKGVCIVYAELFKQLSNKCGLRASIITGDGIVNGELITHAWNGVYIDGVEKYVDTCWNDTSDQREAYLLMSLDEFSITHIAK